MSTNNTTASHDAEAETETAPDEITFDGEMDESVPSDPIGVTQRELYLHLTPRRRHILSLIAMNRGTVAQSEITPLARDVGVKRHRLTQTHLPELEAAGIIDYAPADSGSHEGDPTVVCLRSDTILVEPLLDSGIPSVPDPETIDAHKPDNGGEQLSRAEAMSVVASEGPTKLNKLGRIEKLSRQVGVQRYTPEYIGADSVAFFESHDKVEVIRESLRGDDETGDERFSPRGSRQSVVRSLAPSNKWVPAVNEALSDMGYTLPDVPLSTEGIAGSVEFKARNVESAPDSSETEFCPECGEIPDEVVETTDARGEPYTRYYHSDRDDWCYVLPDETDSTE